MQSKAATVEEYLAELPADRRAIIEAVRKVIKENLDPDYEEGMQYGAISYYVPHKVYPPGYHCDPKQPLPFAGLGSQKNYISMGLMSCYMSDQDGEWLRAAWTRAGKKLDMGVCCIRFKKLEDVPLEVVAEAIRRVPAKKFIEYYESAIKTNKENAARRKAAKAKSVKQATTKKTSTKAAAKKQIKKVAKKGARGGR